MRGLGNVAVAAASVLLALGLIEASLRVLRPHSLSPDLQPYVYEHDPETGYRYRPGAVGRVVREFEIDNVVRINALGFHDVERDLARTDGRRIVAIGDSFTSAKHVPIARGWTQTLERALRASGYPTAEVFNLGQDGTGTNVHAAILARWVERLRPEIVILAFFVNDADDVADRPKQREGYRGYVLGFLDEQQRAALRAWVDAHEPGPVGRWLFENAWISRPLARVVPRWQLLRTNYVTPSRAGILPADTPNPARRMADAFRQLLELGARHGFQLVVAPVPPGDVPRASAGALRRAVGRPFHATLDVIDAAPAMAARAAHDGRTWKDLYWRYDGHFNAYGNELFGTALGPQIAGRLAARASWDRGNSDGCAALVEAPVLQSTGPATRVAPTGLAQSPDNDGRAVTLDLLP